MAIKLMIDSASDINQKEAEDMGVIMLPMVITFGEKEYLDGIDLLPADFYDKLTKSSETPTTSQINPFRFEEEFEKHTANGDQLVVITISSRLSGTYASACSAAEKFPGKVFVVDSLNATAGERLLGQYALRLISEGKSAETIEAALNEAKKRLRVYAMIDTLKYLKKGGRISATTAFVGGLMSIKPMVCVQEGEVKIVGKTVGFNKATAFLNNILAEKKVDENMPYCYLWSGNKDSNLQKYMEVGTGAFKDCKGKYILGGTIGTHIGPGAVGFVFFEEV